MDKVLELGGYAAGYAGRLFVHAGADVVRVEQGAVPPAWASTLAMDGFLHAGKRRIQSTDTALIRQLAEAADVVICEAAGADAVQALGFADWPTAVKVALTPYGMSGPKRNWLATPHTLLAAGGYTALMGDAQRTPLSLPGHYLEFQTGALAYTAANSARLAGLAEDIDIGMLETLMTLSQFTTVRWHCAGELRSRHGSDFWFVVPSELFRCDDGWVYVNIVPQFWDPFTVFLERPELLIDERFSNNDLRMANREALHSLVAEALAGLTVVQVGERAERCRVPVGVVQNFDQVLNDPHLTEREFWQLLDLHEDAAEAGTAIKVPGLPYRLNDAHLPALSLLSPELSPEPKLSPEPELSPELPSELPPELPPEICPMTAQAGDRADVQADVQTDVKGNSIGIAGPLNGIRILDLTHVWAGPLAVRVLADLGAEVVRVEAPTSRGPRVFPSAPIGGWLSGAQSDEPWNDNALFVKLARNRRSLAMDLKTERGHELFLALVAQADVVIENFSARAMPGLGLGYAELRQANPRIVFVSMPGYGVSGPLRDRVAFGPTVEVMCGFTSMMGYGPDEPRNTAMALMDPVAATNATAAVLTALRQREVQGGGVRVEMSLHEGGVSYNGPWLIDQQLGNPPACIGNRHPHMAPHGVYPCAGEDQWLALACADQQQWQKLCQLIDGLDTALDLQQRQQQHDRIDQLVMNWTRDQHKHAAVELLQQQGVSAGAVNTVPDMTADPQVQARGFFVQYERYNRPMPGNPIKMAGLNGDQWRACPRLGADNAQVLADWLQLNEDEINTLQQQGVIADQPPG